MRWATVLGAVLVAIAVILLGASAATAYAIARDPSGRLHGFQPPLNISVAGPSSSFRWVAQGYNVSFQDTSTDNGSTITTWAWEFGDGAYYLGPDPAPHTYDVTCRSCTETVTLAVHDAAGGGSVATAQITLQQYGGSQGVATSPTSQLGVPQIGPLASGLAAAELLAIMVLIGVSVAVAGGKLLRRELEAVEVPVAPGPSP